MPPTTNAKHKLLSNGMEEMTSWRCHDNAMYLMDPLAYNTTSIQTGAKSPFQKTEEYQDSGRCAVTMWIQLWRSFFVYSLTMPILTGLVVFVWTSGISRTTSPVDFGKKVNFYPYKHHDYWRRRQNNDCSVGQWRQNVSQSALTAPVGSAISGSSAFYSRSWLQILHHRRV